MKKNLKLGLAIFAIFSFTCIGTVKADSEAEPKTKYFIYGDNEESILGELKKAAEIDQGQNRLILCAYSCASQNTTTASGGKAAEKWKCGTSTNDIWDIITYNFNGGNYKWGMYTATTASSSGNGYDGLRIDSWHNRTSLSQDSIYYGKPVDDDQDDPEDEPWNKDISSYKLMTNSFVCPKYAMNDDAEEVGGKPDYMEICYADNNESIEACIDSRNESKKTHYEYANPLTYSFAAELYHVLEFAKTGMEKMTDEELVSPYLNMSKYQRTQIEEKICSIAKDEKIEEVMNPDRDQYSAILNNLFSASFDEMADSYGEGKNGSDLNGSAYVRYMKNYNMISGLNGKEIYTAEFLDKILTTGEGTDKSIDIKHYDINGNEYSLKEMYSEISMDKYSEKLTDAIIEYEKKCQEKINKQAEENPEFDENGNKIEPQNVVHNKQELQNKIYNRIGTIKKENINVDITGTLDCDSLFADIATEIKTAYFFLEVLSIVLIVALSALEYAKIILNDNQDEFKKANKKLSRRLILLVTLFLLPAIINIVLRWFKIEGFNSENPLCVNVTEK